MSNEASKTRLIWGDFEKQIVQGKGIDIGCGRDPIGPGILPFDVDRGDANEITRYVHEEFDFVFSCHSLEHMNDPEAALREWWKLVRTHGHLIVIVPDEDLYEQGYFPSLFNGDHKATFTIQKRSSWSPRSHNVTDLVAGLEDAELLSIELQDQGYDRRRLHHGCHSRRSARRGRVWARRIGNLLGWCGISEDRLCRWFRLPIDQTRGHALAQIQINVEKTAHR